MCVICLKPSFTKICGECTFITSSEERRMINIRKSKRLGPDRKFDYLARRIDNNLSRFDVEIDRNRHLSCHERLKSWKVIEQIFPGIRKL